MRFYVATASWLNQIALAGDDYKDMTAFRPVKLPLEAQVKYLLNSTTATLFLLLLLSSSSSLLLLLLLFVMIIFLQFLYDLPYSRKRKFLFCKI